MPNAAIIRTRSEEMPLSKYQAGKKESFSFPIAKLNRGEAVKRRAYSKGFQAC